VSNFARHDGKDREKRAGYGLVSGGKGPSKGRGLGPDTTMLAEREKFLKQAEAKPEKAAPRKVGAGGWVKAGWVDGCQNF
jgi:hypothetical protein